MLLGLATIDGFENGLPEKLRRTGLAISEFLELGLVLPASIEGEDDLLDGSAMEMEFEDFRSEMERENLRDSNVERKWKVGENI